MMAINRGRTAYRIVQASDEAVPAASATCAPRRRHKSGGLWLGVTSASTPHNQEFAELRLQEIRMHPETIYKGPSCRAPSTCRNTGVLLLGVDRGKPRLLCSTLAALPRSCHPSKLSPFLGWIRQLL